MSNVIEPLIESVDFILQAEIETLDLLDTSTLMSLRAKINSALDIKWLEQFGTEDMESIG